MIPFSMVCFLALMLGFSSPLENISEYASWHVHMVLVMCSTSSFLNTYSFSSCPFFLSAVTNKHHFTDGPLLYQFRMNFRRRRRLIELLHERGRSIPESHDSPFCLRKQNSDGGNTSFLSGRNCTTYTAVIFTFLYYPETTVKQFPRLLTFVLLRKLQWHFNNGMLTSWHLVSLLASAAWR